MAERITSAFRTAPAGSSEVSFPTAAPSDAEITALIDSAAAIVDSLPGQVFLKDEVQKDAPVSGPVPATGMKSNKWLVRYTDTVDGSPHSLELPGADLTLLAAGTIFLDLAGGAVAPFVAAFENTCVSPPSGGGVGGGNPVTLESIEYVVRRVNL